MHVKLGQVALFLERWNKDSFGNLFSRLKKRINGIQCHPSYHSCSFLQNLELDLVKKALLLVKIDRILLASALQGLLASARGQEH